jgi:hypothetical protein
LPSPRSQRGGPRVALIALLSGRRSRKRPCENATPPTSSPFIPIPLVPAAPRLPAIGATLATLQFSRPALFPLTLGQAVCYTDVSVPGCAASSLAPPRPGRSAADGGSGESARPMPAGTLRGPCKLRRKCAAAWNMGKSGWLRRKLVARDGFAVLRLPRPRAPMPPRVHLPRPPSPALCRNHPPNCGKLRKNAPQLREFRCATPLSGCRS